MGESALWGGAGEGAGLDGFLGREPVPEDAVWFAELFQSLLSKLDDPTLSTVAFRKLEGYSSAEIAFELGVSARTVDRKIELIRAVWGKEVSGASPGPGR